MDRNEEPDAAQPQVPHSHIITFDCEELGTSDSISRTNALADVDREDDLNSSFTTLYTPRSSLFDSINSLSSLSSLPNSLSSSVEPSPTASTFRMLEMSALPASQQTSHQSQTSQRAPTSSQTLRTLQKEEKRQKNNDRERIVRREKQNVMQQLKSYFPHQTYQSQSEPHAQRTRRKVTDRQVLEWCRDMVVCVNEHPTQCPCKYMSRRTSACAEGNRVAVRRRDNSDSSPENRIDTASI